MRQLRDLVWGPVGLLLLIVGLAGIPDDTTTWGRWVADYAPFLQNVWVLMALIFAGAMGLSIFWGNLIATWKVASRDPHISKLKSRSYVSFGEICEAIPKAHQEYDKGDVRKALMKALNLGHFSKMRIIMRDDQGNRTDERPRITLAEMNEYWQTGKAKTPGAIAFAHAEFHALSILGSHPEDL